MPILGLCRAGSRLYTFGVVPPCSAGPIATVAPAHRGWFVAYPDRTAFFGEYFRIGDDSPRTGVLSMPPVVRIPPSGVFY